MRAERAPWSGVSVERRWTMVRARSTTRLREESSARTLIVGDGRRVWQDGDTTRWMTWSGGANLGKRISRTIDPVALGHVGSGGLELCQRRLHGDNTAASSIRPWSLVLLSLGINHVVAATRPLFYSNATAHVLRRTAKRCPCTMPPPSRPSSSLRPPGSASPASHCRP